jgi:hypothetical protein
VPALAHPLFQNTRWATQIVIGKFFNEGLNPQFRPCFEGLYG